MDIFQLKQDNYRAFRATKSERLLAHVAYTLEISTILMCDFPIFFCSIFKHFRVGKLELSLRSLFFLYKIYSKKTGMPCHYLIPGIPCSISVAGKFKCTLSGFI